MSERVPEEKIGALKKFIQDADISELCKKALWRLIDASDGLSKTVGCFIKDEVVGKEISSSVEKLNLSNKINFWEYEASIGLYFPDGGKGRVPNLFFGQAYDSFLGAKIWISIDCTKGSREFEEIPFDQGEDMTLEIDSAYPSFTCYLKNDVVVSEPRRTPDIPKLFKLISQFKERYPAGRFLLNGTLVKLDMTDETGADYLDQMESQLREATTKQTKPI